MNLVYVWCVVAVDYLMLCLVENPNGSWPCEGNHNTYTHNCDHVCRYLYNYRPQGLGLGLGLGLGD